MSHLYFVVLVTSFLISLASCGIWETPPHPTHTHVQVKGRKYSLKQFLSMVRDDCGDICDTELEGSPGKYYQSIEKEVDCDMIMSSPFMDLSANLDENEVPASFEQLPEDVQEMFTLNGKLRFMYAYMDHSHDPDKERAKRWSIKLVNSLKQQFKDREMHGMYGVNASNEIGDALLEHMSEQVVGGRVLVIGSYSPWIEAMLLELGAKKVITLEYDQLESQHPDIETWMPEDMRSKWMSGELEPFDAVVTFSSLEHSGLGRYGDALNPWGDLITSAKAWCMTRPGGRMLMGLPSGFDGLLFNACRMYGPFLYSHLFANWDQVFTNATMYPDGPDTKPEDWATDSIYGYQPVHVVEKGQRWSQEEPKRTEL